MPLMRKKVTAKRVLGGWQGGQHGRICTLVEARPVWSCDVRQNGFDTLSWCKLSRPEPVESPWRPCSVLWANTKNTKNTSLNRHCTMWQVQKISDLKAKTPWNASFCAMSQSFDAKHVRHWQQVLMKMGRPMGRVCKHRQTRPLRSTMALCAICVYYIYYIYTYMWYDFTVLFDRSLWVPSRVWMACHGLKLSSRLPVTAWKLWTYLRFGVQFHPEKNAFEHGRELSAWFFVNLWRGQASSFLYKACFPMDSQRC